MLIRVGLREPKKGCLIARGWQVKFDRFELLNNQIDVKWAETMDHFTSFSCTEVIVETDRKI